MHDPTEPTMEREMAEEQNMLPVGALLQVRMEIRVPVAANVEQIDEWLQFNIGGGGSISRSNPLFDHPCEQWRGGWMDSDWDGEIGIEEKTEPTESGAYKIVFRRERAER